MPRLRGCGNARAPRPSRPYPPEGVRRFLAILLFATAAASAAAAGSGVIVVPHEDPPGAPLGHRDHVVAAYRLPLLLDTAPATLVQGVVVVTAEGLFDAAAAIVLAVMASLWPRLPRPGLRAVALVPAPSVGEALWRSPQLTGPPRSTLHA